MPGIPPAQTPEPMAVEESIHIPKRPGDGTLQIVPSNFRFKAFLKIFDSYFMEGLKKRKRRAGRLNRKTALGAVCYLS